MTDPNKPRAVIDKSLLQGICALPDDGNKCCFEVLKDRYDVTVAFELIEEVLARYIGSTGEVRYTHQRLLSVIQDLLQNWMEHPAELVFKQLVQKETTLDPWLGPQKRTALQSIFAELDKEAPDLKDWAQKRFREKEERREMRKRQQRLYKMAFVKEFLNPPDLATFLENGILFLCHEMESVDLKMVSLNGYLGSALRRWHADCADQIEKAFSEVTFDSLDQTRFTRNYLLAEVLYDLAPITKLGRPEAEKSNPLVLSGNQINNEEDQQYIACAFACQRLLTCDCGMHKMANVFTERGLWIGRSIYIPPGEIERIETILS